MKIKINRIISILTIVFLLLSIVPLNQLTVSAMATVVLSDDFNSYDSQTITTGNLNGWAVFTNKSLTINAPDNGNDTNYLTTSGITRTFTEVSDTTSKIVLDARIRTSASNETGGIYLLDKNNKYYVSYLEIKNTAIYYKLGNSSTTYGDSAGENGNKYALSKANLTAGTWYYVRQVIDLNAKKITFYIGNSLDNLEPWAGTVEDSTKDIIHQKIDGVAVAPIKFGRLSTASAAGCITALDDVNMYYGATSPVATDISIDGSYRIGQTITASYTYIANDGGNETDSCYVWETASDAEFTQDVNIVATGTTTSLVGASYTLQQMDDDKYIRFGVTPSSDSVLFVEKTSCYSESKLVGGRPVITLKGESIVKIDRGTSFAEPGYTAVDEQGNDISSSVLVSGTIDTNCSGTYELQYDVTDSFNNSAIPVKRTVIVGDFTSPVINLNGADIFLYVGDMYVEPGYTAIDSIDGDITDNVVVSGTVDTNTAGTYTLTYNVSDEAGNMATAKRMITVKMREISPVIELAGDKYVSVLKDEEFIEPGYSALNGAHDDITSKVVISDNIDTSVEGVYVRSYSIDDTSVYRIINVVEAETEEIIIPVSEDTYTSIGTVKGEIQDDMNFGMEDSVKPSVNSLTKDSFFKYDFSSIPENAVIKSAEAYFYYLNDYAYVSPQYTRVIQLCDVKSNDWSEYTLTANIAKQKQINIFNTVTKTNRDVIASCSEVLTSSAPDKWIDFDITLYLSDALKNSSDKVHSFAVAATDSSKSNMVIYSKDTVFTDKRPYIKVTVKKPAHSQSDIMTGETLAFKNAVSPMNKLDKLQLLTNDKLNIVSNVTNGTDTPQKVYPVMILLKDNAYYGMSIRDFERNINVGECVFYENTFDIYEDGEYEIKVFLCNDPIQLKPLKSSEENSYADVFYNADENKITIQINAEPLSQSTIKLLNSGYSNSDITLDNYNDIIVYADMQTTDENGKATFICTLNKNLTPGAYNLVFSGEKDRNDIIYILDVAQKNEVLEYINSKTSDEILNEGTFENKYAEWLSINLKEYNLIHNKKILYDKIVGKNYTKISDIKSDFENVLKSQLATEAIHSVNTATIDSMADIIQKYNSVLKLNLDGNYPENKKVYLTQILKQGFTTLEEIRKCFQVGSVIVNVNNASRLTIEEVLKAVSANISFKFNLNTLTEEEKVAVFSAILANDYETIDSIEKTGNDALDKYRNNKNQQFVSPGGSGGSGGSGGNRGSIKADYDTAFSESEVKPIVFSFNDIDDVAWAKNEILEFAKKGIVAGKAQNEFYPNDYITREEFVKIIIEAFQLKDESAVTNFEDVSKDSWYYPYVATAQKIELVKGNEYGNFGVGKQITREEMSAICFRMVMYMNIPIDMSRNDRQFADKDEISLYAQFPVEAMSLSGVIKGIGNNLFAPKKYSTRAESVVIISRILSLYEQSKI